VLDTPLEKTGARDRKVGRFAVLRKTELRCIVVPAGFQQEGGRWVIAEF